MNQRHLFIAAGLTTIGVLVGLGLKALADGVPSPNPLYYSGTLTEGGKLVNGTRAVTINLWPDATTAGTPLCQTVGSTTNVVGGRFRIALTSSCKNAISQNNNAFVEVIDGATSLGRVPIGAVPYAVEADHAVSAANAVNATSAAYAADAGHASTADNATSATNAASALTAAAVAAGSFSFSTTCAVSGPITGLDCTCPSGTIAVSGGGWCGGTPNNYLIESANVAAPNMPRSLTSWRVNCSAAAPTGDAYALCMKSQ